MAKYTSNKYGGAGIGGSIDIEGLEKVKRIMKDSMEDAKKRRTLLNIHAKDVVVGIPLTKNRLSVAMWVFFIYYLYPIGPLYVLFKHGKIPFNNLGFGCTSIQNIVTNHLPFISYRMF